MLRHDPSAHVRGVAALCLGKTRVEVELASASLATALEEDSAFSVRITAASSLGKLGSKEALVVSALVGALSDPVAAVRINACGAIGEIGVVSADAVEKLEKIIAKIQAEEDKKLEELGEARMKAIQKRDTGQIRQISTELTTTRERKRKRIVEAKERIEKQMRQKRYKRHKKNRTSQGMYNL